MLYFANGKNEICKQLEGRKKKKKSTDTYMITPTNQSTTHTLQIYWSIFPFSHCFSSITVFFASFNKYFRYSKYTNEELILCMWKNLYIWQYWNGSNLNTLYSVNKNRKNTFRFHLGKCRSMRGWLLVEGNPHFPTSFSLLVPLCSASYLLHDSSSRPDSSLLTNFIIYWQIYALTFRLNLSFPWSWQTETSWLVGLPDL